MSLSLHGLDSQNMMLRPQSARHAVDLEFGAALAKPVTASPHGSSIALNYLNINKTQTSLKIDDLKDRNSDLVITEFFSTTPNNQHWIVEDADTLAQPPVLLNPEGAKNRVSKPARPVLDGLATEGIVGLSIDKTAVSSSLKRNFNSLNSGKVL